MHTTAHPDDEHGGLLTQLSRGQGARVSLLTLNRGESGDNAIGSELFDAVGLIRTEELLMAGRYYGLDRQYFTTMIDYGFSKRLEETLVEVGTRERAARRRARHPDGPSARAHRALSGQRRATATATTRRPASSRRRPIASPATRRSSPSRFATACAPGSR